MATTLVITTFPPFPSLTLTLPSETRLADLPSFLPDFIPSFSETGLTLTRPSGSLPPDSTPLGALWADTDFCSHGSEDEDRNDAETLTHRLISLRLMPRVRGGKGGFGSQLRAAGGRMSSQKTNNNDSCRDLNGRRLSTLKEAKTLAAYLESESERKKAQQEAQRAKLEKLEKRLGIHGKGKDKSTQDGDDIPVGTKRRFDDTEYLEQSREIVDNVKNAVTAGLLKKKKKVKTSPISDLREVAPSLSSLGSPSKNAGGSEGSPTSDNESSKDRSTEKAEKALESPITAATAAATTVSLAAIGA